MSQIRTYIHIQLFQQSLCKLMYVYLVVANLYGLDLKKNCIKYRLAVLFNQDMLYNVKSCKA